MESLLPLLQYDVLIPWLLGIVFGVFVGSTPGLTATMAVALLVPFTFYLPNPNTGLALILGMSFTAIFAGDIPAVYLRIPGTPASATGTLDGHPMALAGKGRRALTLDLGCSVLGGIVGTALLWILAPQLARFALRFSHYEYFWLGVAGLAISAVVTQGPAVRGMMGALLGMLLATVGIDRVSGTPRFTWGQPELAGGIDFIAVMIGLFGLGEVLRNVRRGSEAKTRLPPEEGGAGFLEMVRDMARHKLLLIRSALLGTGVGVLPGAGADIAAWASYGVAQRTSRTPERFGKGCVEGVMAPSTANNAAVAGAWIPALVFGIPGDSITAVALGALLMYDIKPGPLVFEQNPGQMRSILLIAFITQFLLIPAGWIGIRAFGWVVRLPRAALVTSVIVFSVVGSYSLRNSLFDVWVALAAGVVGVILEARGIPPAPLILGLILGPMIEDNLRTGLIKSQGDFTPFLTRPLCLALIALMVSAALLPRWLRRLRTGPPRGPVSGGTGDTSTETSTPTPELPP
ncbi:MAG: tripartite tricarboxylate transporter permease [Limisphaerales bacterium]